MPHQLHHLPHILKTKNNTHTRQYSLTHTITLNAVCVNITKHKMCRTKIYDHIPDTLAISACHTSWLLCHFIGKSVNSNDNENTPGGCGATQFLWAIKFYKLQNALSRSSDSNCACLPTHVCVVSLGANDIAHLCKFPDKTKCWFLCITPPR